MATMNGMPRVTQDATVAVMQKATTIDMAEFGVQVLDELHDEQPALCEMLTFMTMDLACNDEIPDEMRAANALVMTVIAGCLFKAIKAQIEAEEMASLFSEEGELHE